MDLNPDSLAYAIATAEALDIDTKDVKFFQGDAVTDRDWRKLYPEAKQIKFISLLGPVLSSEGNRKALESTYKMMQKGDKLVAGTYVADEKSPHFKLCTSNLENTKPNNRFIECYTRTEGEAIRILHQSFAESPKDFANLMEQVGFWILDKRVGSMGMRTAAMFVAEQNQGS